MSQYYAETLEHLGPHVFGRVHGNEAQCREILSIFHRVTACFEKPDSGCEREHCHFIGFGDFKDIKTLRNALYNKCKKVLNQVNQYSIKPFDNTQAQSCFQYICKDEGLLPDMVEPPTNIFINEANIPIKDLQEFRQKFYESEFYKKRVSKKENKNPKEKAAFWKKIYEYIKGKDPSIFNKCKQNTPKRIAQHVYDYFEENEKFLQNDRFIELTIKTIMIQAYRTKTLRETLKKSMVENWISNFSQLCYYDYTERDSDSDSDDDLF